MITNLKTTFAGLKLSSPIIASASPLTATAEQCVELEKAGVAAIVVKSIFEESIAHNSQELADVLSHGEETDYLDGYIGEQMVSEWRSTLKSIKDACTVPIIASMACRKIDTWERYARVADEVGVDALELNLMNVARNTRHTPYGDTEHHLVHTVEVVRKITSLPIIVKLASNMTNPAALVDRLKACGADGVVLFNRMVTPDINLKTLSYGRGEVLGSSTDLYESLRWIGLASDRVPKLSYAASGGVSNGEAMIKALLVGASAVEVCSVLYKKGIEAIPEMLQTLEEWMKANNYQQVSDFRGVMNARKTGGGAAFERTQFFKHYGKYE